MSKPCAGKHGGEGAGGQTDALREIRPSIEHAHDVLLRFLVRRNAAVFADGLRSGVVCGEDQTVMLGRSAGSARAGNEPHRRDSAWDRAD